MTKKLYPGLKIQNFVLVEETTKTILLNGMPQKRSAWIVKYDHGQMKIIRADYIQKIQNKPLSQDLRVGTKTSNSNQVYKTYRFHAKQRGYEFEISKDDFQLITSQNCYYCDAAPSNKGNHHKKEGEEFIYNGIDRFDNKIGYHLSNCVACCRICNLLKNDLSFDEFISHIHKILKHNPQKR